MIPARAFVVWLVIIATETIHGILRNLFLAPITGDFHARQITVFTGALLILFISLLFVKWLKVLNKSDLLAIGFFWVCLTLIFEISLGRLSGFSWNRILSDYNLLKGGLLPLGLFLMMLSPYTAAKIRKLN